MSHLCSKTSFLFKGISGYHNLMKTQDTFNLLERYPEIEHKLKIINFFNKYGLNPTKDAFSVSRAGIYLWKKKLKESNGRLYVLKNQSRKPHNTRRMYLEPEIYQFIKNLREQYPRLSKDKIKPLLDEFCQKNGLTSMSASKIGKVIKRHQMFFYLHNRRKPISKKTKKRIFGYEVKNIGDLIQVDAIVKFQNGIKRYIITSIETQSKFAFAYAYKTLSSKTASDFIQKLIKVSPFTIKAIQTDNGSEFLKQADKTMEKRGIVHFFTYPKSPKSNAFIERFNRTIQEEFTNSHQQDLTYQLTLFNQYLMDYLLFYNTKRIHHSLNNIVPMKYIIKKSNMYGTDTQD